MTRRCVAVLVLLFLLVPLAARADGLASALARLEPFARRGMEEWKVPGMAVAVVRGGKVAWAKGFGTRRAGADLPVTPDTIFQVGSTTKAFTVAVMATLVDEGVIDWDDRVAPLFPDFALADPWVTREFLVHDLFAQHSGMPPYAGDLQFLLGHGRDHVVESMRHIAPASSFRDQFAYVNNLFVAGGMLEELVADKPWETLMQERLLTPLGMTRSSLDEAGLTGAANGASLHVLVKGEAVPLAPGSLLLGWPYVAGPAGGLNSSALDMARWVAAQLGDGQLDGRRVFSEASAAYMRTPRTPLMMGPHHAAYCQGWMRTELPRTDVVWHNGGTSGVCAFVGFSPALDAGIVVLTNLGHHKLADAVGLQFFDLLSGNDGADWLAGFRPAGEEPAPAEPAAPAEPGLAPDRYAGTYDNPVLGPLTAREEGGGLVVRLGEDGRVAILLRREAGHAFVGDWPDIDPDDPAVHFDFQVDGQGAVTGVIFREYNDDGCGEFTRR
ncbi:MAG: serine hydrolase [Pseudodesulfovibrio sp.]